MENPPQNTPDESPVPQEPAQQLPPEPEDLATNPPRAKSRFIRFVAKNVGILVLGILTFAVFFSERAFPQIDEKTDAYFEKVIVQAGATFGVARAIDSGISIIQGSSISVTPFGVGTDLAIGQILDPADDAIERLSNILFASIVSLIIQKTVYEIIGAFAVYCIFGVFVLACISLLFTRSERMSRIGIFLKRLCLFLIFVRISLPCSVWLSNEIEDDFFRPRIEECSDKLGIFAKGVDLTDFDAADGTWDKAKALSKEIPEVVMSYARNAREIVGTSLEVAGLYVTLFIVQVIIIPIGGLFLLVKTANLLFALDLPVIVKLSSSRRAGLPEIPEKN